VSGAAPHSQTPNPAIVGMRLPEQGICNRPALDLEIYEEVGKPIYNW
jgi:hypothetical protein